MVKEQREGATAVTCSLPSVGPSGLPELFLKGPKKEM